MKHTHPKDIKASDRITFEPERLESVMVVTGIELRPGAATYPGSKSFSMDCDLWEIATDKGLVCVRTRSDGVEVDAPLYVIG